jgi:integrase/recombinase XerD
MKTTLIVARPPDELELAPELDDRYGVNRSHGHMQITATDDLSAIQAWLTRFCVTKATFDSYRREVERLLLWSLRQLGKPLSSLTHEDLLAYQRFLANPQPHAIWVATGRKFPRDDPRWRPFHGPLSGTSRRQAMVVLNSLFSWLVQVGYLAANPLSLSRRRTRHAPPPLARDFESDLWQEVSEYIAVMPQETERARAHYHRVRWVFTLLYLGGLRIAEVSDNTMGQFFARRDANGMPRWWLAVRGKGGKERLVPATRELVTELSRYRQHLGMAAMPSPGESTPLVAPVAARGSRTRRAPHRPLTRGALHTIVKDVFASTAARLRERDESLSPRAALLEQASAHWLRNSMASHTDNQQVDLRLVRDNRGHASPMSTNRYPPRVDDDRETHEKHRIGW